MPCQGVGRGLEPAGVLFNLDIREDLDVDPEVKNPYLYQKHTL
jgi:hypothetical protein